MLHKGETIQWTERRQQAFDALKQILTTAPVLGPVRDDCDFVLDVDASMVGAEAVLQQYQDGVLRVIEYVLRSFSREERQYCVSRREMSALIFGLRHFRQYLLGRHFLVRVDHMAITYYRKVREPTGQLARHMDFIAEFDFDCRYRAGRTHINCDTLSRLSPCEVDSGEPCRQCQLRVTGRHGNAEGEVFRVTTRAGSRQQTGLGLTDDNGAAATGPDAGLVVQRSAHRAVPPIDLVNDHVVLPATMTVDVGRPPAPARRRRGQAWGLLDRTAPAAVAAGVGDWNAQFLRDQQLADPDVGPALRWIDGGDGRPVWGDVKSCSPYLRSLWQQYESLVLRDGVLHRIFHDVNGLAQYYQYVLPASLKVPFLELIHSDAAGHLKFAKCIDHVTRRAWWLSWRRDLKLFCDCCSICSAYHRGAAPRQGRLHPMVLGGPGERWAIDLTGPHPSSNGYQYLFTLSVRSLSMVLLCRSETRRRLQWRRPWSTMCFLNGVYVSRF